MKTKRTSHLCLVICILIGTLPTTTQAQQNTDLDIINAKADAIRDAKADVNPFAWFTIGCVLPYTSLALVGTSDTRIISWAALSVPILGILTLYYYPPPPDPPTNRFIGKTPQYVDTYIATYKTKSRNRQTLLAAAGVANGCIIFSSFFFGIVVCAKGLRSD